MSLSFPGLIRLLLSLLFVRLSLSFFAQQAEVTRYDVEQGLPQSMVNHVLQDVDGFIWLGTGDGLARFDGHRFVVYKHDPRDSTTLSHNSIWGLAEKDERHLWVGTRSGLDVLDRRTGRVKQHDTGLTPGQDGCWTILSDIGDELVCYSPLNGHLLRIGPNGQRLRRLVHTESYAMHLHASSGTITQYLQPDSLLTIAVDGGDQVAILPTTQQERVTDLVEIDDRWLMLSDKSAWLWSPARGRQPLPPATQAWMDHTSESKRGAIADDGSIWVACSGQGVVVLDTALHIVRSYPLLPPTERPLDITSITFDRQGNTWVGTDGKGVFKIAPQRIKFGRCMPGQGLPWEPASWFVRGFAQWDAGHVLVSFYQGGLALFDEQTGHLSPLQLMPAAQRTLEGKDFQNPFTDRNGLIWGGDLYRVVAIERGTGRLVFTEHLPRGNARAPGPDGDAVIMSMDAIRSMRCRNGSVVPESHASPRLLDHFNSLGLTPDKFSIDHQWTMLLGSTNIPIQAWRNDAEVPFGPFPAAVRLTSLIPDDGHYSWVTTSDGLYQVNATNLAVNGHWTIHNGLPDQFLYGMLPASDGKWWLSSNKGLSHFDPLAKRFTNYSRVDGLQSAEFNSHAYFRSLSGRLFFGGVNGFNHLMPGALPRDGDTARVVLIGVQMNDSIMDPGEFNTPMELELPYGRNHIQLDLAVLEFTAPEHNRYRFRVTGYTDWVEQAGDRPIVLNNVPDGRYSVEVEGVNGDGLRSIPRTLLLFHVPLPFHASPWAFLLGGAMIIGLLSAALFILYRHRIQRREERTEQELKELRIRARVSQDLHDDVGSGLARIAALSRSAVVRTRKGEHAGEQVEKLTTLSQELMHDLRDVVWMNDPRGGELADLLLRIRDHVRDLFEGTETLCTVEFPSPLPERSIGPAAKREVYLIAKEAAHNASKYSKASAVLLRFELYDHVFRLTVADNGVGKNEGAANFGHGLRNMRERASVLGCTLEAGNRSGGGFQVVLAGPLPTLQL